MIGLDRYWAITSPVAYMNKRNKKSGGIMISSVWVLSILISLAPFLGWKSSAGTSNHRFDNATQAFQCLFLDLPAYTVYSATGSFFLPTIVMFFVYTKIYQAFADHRARQIYRQKVIRRHIESTILHEISRVLPTSDEFAKSDEEYEDDDSYSDEEEEDFSEDSENMSSPNPPIIEEEENGLLVQQLDGAYNSSSAQDQPQSILVRPGSRRRSGRRVVLEARLSAGNASRKSTGASSKTLSHGTSQTSIRSQSSKKKSTKLSRAKSVDAQSFTDGKSDNPRERKKARRTSSVDPSKSHRENRHIPESIGGVKISKKLVRIRASSKASLLHRPGSTSDEHTPLTPRNSTGPVEGSALRKTGHNVGKGSPRVVGRLKEKSQINFEHVMRHKNRKEKRAHLRKSLQKKPAAISAAKERRGVKVLGIILGCFLVCWTPFFVMYLVREFCEICRPNVHVDQFITWLGYSNSAMNPIIYTVFNRDYQTALKRLFSRRIRVIRKR